MKTNIKTLQLKALSEFPDNPQDVPTEKMAIIKRNMREQGWYGEIPLVWQTDDKAYIVSGNHRVQAAIDVGILEQRCIVIDDPKYNWERAKKDVIMFNTLHGEPDEMKLKDFVNNIVDEFDCNLDEFVVHTGLYDYEVNDLISQKDPEIKKINTNGYDRSHVLISFPPEVFIDIKEFLYKIKNINRVEYEESAN